MLIVFCFILVLSLSGLSSVNIESSFGGVLDEVQKRTTQLAPGAPSTNNEPEATEIKE